MRHVEARIMKDAACVDVSIYSRIKKTNVTYKTKESTVATQLKETFPGITWLCDKQIEGGCSRRRPNLLLDMGSNVVIV